MPEPRILQYRKYSRVVVGGYKKFSCGLAVVGAVLLALALLHVGGGKRAEMFGLFSALSGIIAVIFYGMAWIFFRNDETSRFQVFSDRLVVIRGKHERVFPFSEVVRVEATGASLRGDSFRFQLRDGGRRSFASSIENVHEILDAVVQANPGVMDREAYLSLRTRLALASRVYERSMGSYRVYLGGMLLAAAAATIALFFWQRGSYQIRDVAAYFEQTLRVLVLVSAVAVALPIWLAKRIAHRRAPTEQERALDLERALFRKYLFASSAAAVALVAVIGQLGLNQVETVMTWAPASEVGVARHDSVWLDRRFNCLECAHPLRVGDYVVFRRGAKSYAGKIEALPGEVAQVRNGFQDRVLADGAPRKLAPRQFAIRVGSERSTLLLVNLTQVDGRVLRSVSDLFASSVAK